MAYHALKSLRIGLSCGTRTPHPRVPQSFAGRTAAKRAELREQSAFRRPLTAV